MQTNDLYSPSEIPDHLLEVVALSDQLDGETLVFAPDDRVVYASPAARVRYGFLDFDSEAITYAHVYWGALEHGLVNPESMILSAEEYFAMANACRRAHFRFDFVKPYANTTLLGHHRSVGRWNAQVRLPLNDPQFGGIEPATLVDAVDIANKINRERTALDALAVGVVFVDQQGRLLWSNTAGADLLAAIPAHVLADVVAAAFNKPDRQWLTMPVPDDQPILGSVQAQANGQAMLLLSPPVRAEQMAEALAALELRPAEARIAATIAGGISTQEAATRLGQTWGTVRSQLSAIFGRISSLSQTNQAGVTHLVCRLAALAGPSRRRLH